MNGSRFFPGREAWPKSTVVMFIVLYLVLTGRKHNIMMVSATQGAAVRLLDPYRKELESNPRLRGLLRGTNRCKMDG